MNQQHFDYRNAENSVLDQKFLFWINRIFLFLINDKKETHKLIKLKEKGKVKLKDQFLI